MARTAAYQEHAPHIGLRRYVACYWSIRCRGVAPASARDTVVPDACLDFLFDLLADRTDLIGTMTRPLAVPRAATMDILGVRFRPGGVGAFVGIPAHEVTDQVVTLDEVWGPDARRLARQLSRVPSTSARVALLDAVLLDRLSAGRPADGRALEAAALIERAEGRIVVDALARVVGLSRRQFERRFRATVGVAPKVACRVLRFQAARRRLEDHPARSLATVAIEAGYHDQAHLTREFSALSGLPPAAYRRAEGLGA